MITLRSEPMDDVRISLFRAAKVLRVSMPYLKMVLETESIMPLHDCEELRFVTYWQSDVRVCFPDIEF